MESQRANWWETPEETAEREEAELCEHLLDYGRRRKFDGGRCPLLCEGCHLIVGWWKVAEGGTLAEGPFHCYEWLCLDPEHPGCQQDGEPIEYLLWEGDQPGGSRDQCVGQLRIIVNRTSEEAD